MRATPGSLRTRPLLGVLAAGLLTFGTAAALPSATAEPAGPWQVSRATWYGPGLYGNRTACGQTLTPDLQGVAHRTLPCGTTVEFEWHGQHVVAPVVDRGPYGNSAEWDLTAATCRTLTGPGGPDRCSTGAIAWRR